MVFVGAISDSASTDALSVIGGCVFGLSPYVVSIPIRSIGLILLERLAVGNWLVNVHECISNVTFTASVWMNQIIQHH